MYLSAIYPNRITKYYKKDTPHYSVSYWNEKIKAYSRENSVSIDNLKKKRSNWKLSYQTKMKIKDSIQLLYTLSPRRKAYNGNTLVSKKFKALFVTLTLPSKQKHTDIEIKECLNRFLVNIRKVYNVENYVWKAELQQNNNIHFHLVLDRYIHHNAIRYYWNMAVSPLNYVLEYQNKYKNMTIEEYCRYRNISIEKGLKGYRYGTKTNWSDPPTENVQILESVKQVSHYLSKYLAKEVKEETTESEKERILSFGRVWARSQSLSQFQLEKKWSWDNIYKWLKEYGLKLKDMFFIKEYDYCTIYYVKEQTPPRLKRYIQNIIYECAKRTEYPIPI